MHRILIAAAEDLDSDSEEHNMLVGFAACLNGEAVQSFGCDDVSHYRKKGWRVCNNLFRTEKRSHI